MGSGSSSDSSSSVSNVVTAVPSGDPVVDAQRWEEDLMFRLVEWVSPHLPVGTVLAWQPATVKQVVLEISDFDPQKFWDFRAASLYRLQGDSKLQFSQKGNEGTVFPSDLAQDLLRLDQRLSKLRFKLVPARLKEEQFWEQYFEQVIVRLTASLCPSRQEPSDDLDTSAAEEVIHAATTTDLTTVLQESVQPESTSSST